MTLTTPHAVHIGPIARVAVRALVTAGLIVLLVLVGWAIVEAMGPATVDVLTPGPLPLPSPGTAGAGA